MEELIKKPFEIHGKDVLTPEEFIFTLSLDLKFLSPKEARDLLRRGEESGLIFRKGGKIKLKREGVFGRIVKRIAKEKRMSEQEVLALVREMEDLLEIEVSALLVAKKLGVGIEDLVEEVWNELLDKRNTR
ncbi:MAG: DUF2240 family protein [Candidatus Syntropharchaeia archaeon]